MNREIGNVFREFYSLLNPFDIGICLLMLIKEKRYVDMSDRNWINLSQVWLSKQGFNYWLSDNHLKKYKKFYRFDHQLWSCILEDEIPIQQFHQIKIVLDEKFTEISQSTRFFQIITISRKLTNVNKICFKQKELFQHKHIFQKLIQYVIKLIVCRHLQSKVYRRKIFVELSEVLFPVVLQQMIFNFLQ